MEHEGPRGVAYKCDLCGQDFRVTSVEQKLTLAMFGVTCPDCIEAIERRVREVCDRREG